MKRFAELWNQCRRTASSYLSGVLEVFMVSGALGGLVVMALLFFVILWSIPLAIAIGILKLCGVF